MCISLVHVDQKLNICPIKIVDLAVTLEKITTKHNTRHRTFLHTISTTTCTIERRGMLSDYGGTNIFPISGPFSP